jgi:hypothetical protein
MIKYKLRFCPSCGGHLPSKPEEKICYFEVRTWSGGSESGVSVRCPHCTVFFAVRRPKPKIGDEDRANPPKYHTSYWVNFSFGKVYRLVSANSRTCVYKARCRDVYKDITREATLTRRWDPVNECWYTIDEVYETIWDCSIVRREAA